MLAGGVEEVDNEASSRDHIGGSRVGRQVLFCDREFNHVQLHKDYFSQTLTYGPIKFCRRYRMRRELFRRIMDAVAKHGPWFVQKYDAVERQGLSTLHKCTIAIKMLVYGLPMDACDEYCRLDESTTLECMKRFVIAICVCFQSTYLRQPTREDIQR